MSAILCQGCSAPIDSIDSIDNLDMAVKALFRARGESQRIKIADALGRQAYRKLKLETLFEGTISGMHYCLKIRNQYAHCNWHDDNTGCLSFLNMEQIAKKKRGD